MFRHVWVWVLLILATPAWALSLTPIDPNDGLNPPPDSPLPSEHTPPVTPTPYGQTSMPEVLLKKYKTFPPAPTIPTEFTTPLAIIGHLRTLPDDQLMNILLRGEDSLGTCSIRKSNGSTSCQYRLKNYNGTVLCFNGDSTYPVIGVARGAWINDPVLRNSLTSGSPVGSSKEYFDNVRLALNSAADAKAKTLLYVRNYLFVNANPCQLQLTHFQSPTNVDISSHTAFKFYKVPSTKEIYCSSTSSTNRIWSSNCTWVAKPQFFDPKWCKRLYTYFSTKTMTSYSHNGTVVPINQIELQTLGPDLAKEAAIQLFPIELGLQVEDATTRLAIFDNMAPDILQLAEYDSITPAVVAATPVDRLVRFYKWVSTTPTEVRKPQHMDNLKANILTHVNNVVGLSNSYPSFNADMVDSAKASIRQTADMRIATVLTSVGQQTSSSGQLNAGGGYTGPMGGASASSLSYYTRTDCTQTAIESALSATATQ